MYFRERIATLPVRKLGKSAWVYILSRSLLFWLPHLKTFLYRFFRDNFKVLRRCIVGLMAAGRSADETCCRTFTPLGA